MRVQLKRMGISAFFLCHLMRAVWAADLDSDGDGVIDSEDPNPSNSQVVPWRSLGSWRFSNGNFLGDDGQQPIVQSNVTSVPNGFQGPGIRLAGPSASLKFRAAEPSGRPNISALRGSLLFRIKPEWSSGAGPGGWATVLQTTNFAVRITPNGSSLVLTSVRNGITVTNVQIQVALRRNTWSYGLVTYAPEESSLSFDAPSTRVAGTGVAPPANLNSPDNFLAIGSAADGSSAINGLIDEIVAFNAPGVLAVTPTTISAIASDNPPGLNLVWTSPTNAITEVKRRLVGAAAWDTTRAAFGTGYFDSSVIPGERYEYNLNTRIADFTSGLPEEIGQFLKASLNGAPLHEQGKLILLVDETLAQAIEPDLGDFITQLVGDGWQVLRANVPRHVDDPAQFLTNSRNITNGIAPFIRSQYAQFGSQIKYILAIGHVPIPYTGTLADDGHTSPGVSYGAHTGAWACDLFYGDIDGVWTDLQNAGSSSFPFNRNAPGDGRFDQNRIPANPAGISALEIPVARIDFASLPAFRDSEAVLLKKYLKKNSEFRRGIRTFSANAIAAENLPLKSTAPYELASELLSKASVLKRPLEGDVFTDSRSFLFGIQSGPGAFDRINDAFPNYQHTTEDIARGVRGANCAFFFLRGSFFPDWNTQNNLLRAVLATPNGGLASAAFFLKVWRADGLAVGLPLGAEMTDLVNTWSARATPQSVRSIQILGDPTLRYPILPPPGTATAKIQGNRNVVIKWNSSRDTKSYYVYRSTTGPAGPFQVITPSEATTNSYTDSAVPDGRIVYMIRGAALATTGGGTFTNLSQGVFTREISIP